MQKLTTDLSSTPNIGNAAGQGAELIATARSSCSVAAMKAWPRAVCRRIGLNWLPLLLLLLHLIGSSCFSADDSPSLDQKPAVGKEPYDKAVAILRREYLDTLPEDIAEARQLLEEASEAGYLQATRVLADLLFLGRNSKPDFERACELYSQLASEKGDPMALHILGLAHYEGLGAELSVAKDFRPSHLVLGYRYLNGIGVEQSCMTAREHYLSAAEQIAEVVRKDPRRAAGVDDPRKPRLLTDDAVVGGGLWGRLKQLLGKPSSVSHPDALGPREPHTQKDIIEFYRYAQAGSDAQSQMLLGHVYYFGAGDLKPSLEDARRHFERASEQGSPTAAAFLGLMWMRGDGVPHPDYRKAYIYFRKAIRHNIPTAINGMGMLYWHGWDVVQDRREALKLFQQASALDYADAFYNTAMVLAELDPVANADAIFQNLLAAVQGGYALANYEIVSRFLRSEGSCHLSILLLRTFLERVDVPRMFEHALSSYAVGDFEAALTRYLFLAEQGHVTAQHNAAFILERHGDGPDEQRRALVQWQRAANQGDVAARLKVGDYYYHHGDHVAAMAAYYQATERQPPSAQALYNIAYMYHRGLGCDADYWMAMRYYYGAMNAHPAAWLPVSISLLMLDLSFYGPSLRETALLVASIVTCFMVGYLIGRRRSLPVSRRSSALQPITTGASSPVTPHQPSPVHSSSALLEHGDHPTADSNDDGETNANDQHNE